MSALRLRPSCLRSPCGTWPVSFSIVSMCQESKTNSMLECFGISSRVTGFARPMSRRTVTNRRELLLPPLIPDRHQTRPRYDSCVRPVAVAATNGAGEDPSRCGTRQSIRCLAAKQASPTTEAAGLELTHVHLLLAGLVFQQIRPRIRSGAAEGQGRSDKSQVGRMPASAPNVPSARTGQSVLPHEVPVPPPVETLFTELARRRLRRRATKETR